MEEIVVVGGGVAGLLAANVLWNQGVEFRAFERSEVLGSDLATGHHRFYEAGARGFLESVGVRSEWKQISEQPAELKKGKLVDVQLDDFTTGQRYFLGGEFHVPVLGYQQIVQQLIEQVGKKFEIKKVIQELDLENRKIRFSDGSEASYTRLIWCQSLDSLFKAVKGAQSDALIKSKKSAAVEEEEGGLVLEMQFRESFTEKSNTLVLPFRFKDEIHRALGNRDDFGGNEVQYTWTIFLDDGLLDNREEVAKCVRTFKREFFKQFPQASELLIRERIVFLPSISEGSSVEAKSLELFPNVAYLGSQIRLKDSAQSLQNLDLLIENCRHLTAAASSKMDESADQARGAEGFQQ